MQLEIKHAIAHTPSVMLIGNGLAGGGAEGRFARLAAGLFSGSSDIVTLVGNNISPKNHHGQLLELKWHSRNSYPRMILTLRQYLKKRQHDVIMSFGLFPIVITALAIAGLRNRPKFIINEITMPIKAVMASGLLRRIAYTLLYQVFYRQADFITANSIDGLKETCQIAHINIEHGMRLPNVIDNKFINQKLQNDKLAFLTFGQYIVCIGRLVSMKRIDTIIDAFYALPSHINCSLIVVGDGPTRQDLESKVHSLSLQKSVIFTGRLENPLPILKKASAFILASEYEGFSNSVLEAMFCDIPVITSLCSSDAYEMCEKGAALGFEVGNMVQLTEHITAILNDESLAQKLVYRAREYRTPHAMENAIPVYEDLIRHVAGYKVSNE